MRNEYDNKLTKEHENTARMYVFEPLHEKHYAREFNVQSLSLN